MKVILETCCVIYKKKIIIYFFQICFLNCFFFMKEVCISKQSKNNVHQFFNFFFIIYIFLIM